jgi:hypothetical protein
MSKTDCAWLLYSLRIFKCPLEDLKITVSVLIFEMQHFELDFKFFRFDQRQRIRVFIDLIIDLLLEGFQFVSVVVAHAGRGSRAIRIAIGRAAARIA